MDKLIYVIVFGYTMEQIEVQVSTRLKDGYRCVGGVAANGGTFFQAMVLKEFQ